MSSTSDLLAQGNGALEAAVPAMGARTLRKIGSKQATCHFITIDKIILRSIKYFYKHELSIWRRLPAQNASLQPEIQCSSG
jgi:hypothetical protein